MVLTCRVCSCVSHCDPGKHCVKYIISRLTSVNKLRRAAKELLDIKPTLQEVKHYLKGDDTYTLHKPEDTVSQKQRIGEQYRQKSEDS